MVAGEKNLNPLATVAAELVASDPDLRAELQGLVKALIRDAKHTVKYGTATERQALMKAIVPNLLRSMQSADAEAADEERRAAYDRMLAGLRGDDDG